MVKKTLFESRIIQQFIIKDSNLGFIDLAISFPNTLPDHPVPILFILGGLETGFESVRYVTDIGDNILVGYNWPIDSKLPKGINLLIESPAIYRKNL